MHAANCHVDTSADPLPSPPNDAASEGSRGGRMTRWGWGRKQAKVRVECAENDAHSGVRKGDMGLGGQLDHAS
eukprot:2893221-Pyramimonas_sp.AAC.1